MNKLYKYFIKVRKDLLFLLLISLCTYFLIEFWFINYDELFPGAHKVGRFFSNLSISYISAFIFYFIVVHVKSEKDKEDINEFVGIKVYSIITSSHLFIQPFLTKENRNARFENFDLQDLGKLLRSIERESKEAPYGRNNEIANWLEWYEYLRASTLDSIKCIFDRYQHVDTKLIKLITRIENSLFFSQWNLLYNFDFDKTFGLYEFQIKTYLKLISELKDYAEVNLKEYQSVRSEFLGVK